MDLCNWSHACSTTVGCNKRPLVISTCKSARLVRDYFAAFVCVVARWQEKNGTLIWLCEITFPLLIPFCLHVCGSKVPRRWHVVLAWSHSYHCSTDFSLLHTAGQCYYVLRDLVAPVFCSPAQTHCLFCLIAKLLIPCFILHVPEVQVLSEAGEASRF